jgi:hypothetical protein
MVEVVKKPGFDTPVPEVIATFPGESTTPTCNTMTFKTRPGASQLPDTGPRCHPERSEGPLLVAS